MSETVVLLKSVNKTYRIGSNEVHALRDVNLSIKHGELVVILGPSGCGKSTLLNVIGGLDSPTSGHVVIDGQDVTKHDERQLTAFRRDMVGFVFQFFNLVPTLSALENVQLAAELVKNPRDVRTVVREVGLEGREHHAPNELSGGEQQRVAIARGLVKNPPLLLCDEPTGELDIETGRKILALLRQVTRDFNQTVLIVTHNSVIAKMADRVVRLRDGQIVSDERNAAPLSVEEIDW